MSELLKKFGITPEQLPDEFQGFQLGRVLIMDGDAACYQASATSKKLETAQRRFTTLIYEAMFLTKAETARVHLTPKGCYKNGRHLLLGAKPYQGNRKNKAKPPLLEALRGSAAQQFASHESIEVFGHYDVEADDSIMQDAYSVENAIVWSEDKDLQIVPCLKYDIGTGIVHKLSPGDRYGWIAESYTDGGTLKIKGHGTKFFWCQMLMGDTADNVKGILKYDGKLCGPAAAYAALDGIDNESHACNLVLNGYRSINQNPIPEAEALWLTRCVGDNAVGYIWSLDLTEQNRNFVLDCYNRKWKLTDEEWNEQYGSEEVE